LNVLQLIAELKGTHTQEFTIGYLSGIQGYWWDRGLAEEIEDYHDLYIISVVMVFLS
jgi:hypothetical protein